MEKSFKVILVLGIAFLIAMSGIQNAYTEDLFEISILTQAQIGTQLMRQLQQFKTFVPSTESTKNSKINRIGQKLLTQALSAKMRNEWKKSTGYSLYTGKLFTLLQSREPDSISFPGSILVDDRFAEYSDDVIAYVLAHEIYHSLTWNDFLEDWLNREADKIKSEMKANIDGVMFAISASGMITSPQVALVKVFAAQIAKNIGDALITKVIEDFHNENEKRAEDYAKKLIKREGYYSEKVEEFLNRRQPTHPLKEQRKNIVAAWIEMAKILSVQDAQLRAESVLSDRVTNIYKDSGGISGFGGSLPKNYTIPNGIASTNTPFKAVELSRGGIYEYSRGIFVVQGGIYGKYRAIGGARHPLGLPIINEQEAQKSPFGTTGRVSLFEKGSIVWVREKDQKFVVQGAIFDKWALLGPDGVKLGFPISDQYSYQGGTRSDFEGGYIIWNSQAQAQVFIKKSAEQGQPIAASPSPMHKIPDEKSLVRGTDENIYLIAERKKRHITSPEVFQFMGLDWNAVIKIDDFTVGSIPTGTPISTTKGYCTDYVKEQRAKIGAPVDWIGDAYLWFDRAKNYDKGSMPGQKGDIVAFKETKSNQFGHVAFVESISPKEIVVSEMNFGDWLNKNKGITIKFGEVSSRRIPVSDLSIRGFIYTQKYSSIILPALVISSISPSSARKGQTVTFTLSGMNFQSGLAAKLISELGVEYNVSSTQFVSSTSVKVTVFLGSGPTSTQTIKIKNPSGNSTKITFTALGK